MRFLEEVKALLTDTLYLGERGAELQVDSHLLGSLPELDSMAVISLVAAIEEHFGIQMEDDDISADTFATVGSLAEYIDRKKGA